MNNPMNKSPFGSFSYGVVAAPSYLVFRYILLQSALLVVVDTLMIIFHDVGT